MDIFLEEPNAKKVRLQIIDSKDDMQLLKDAISQVKDLREKLMMEVFFSSQTNGANKMKLKLKQKLLEKYNNKIIQLEDELEELNFNIF